MHVLCVLQHVCGHLALAGATMKAARVSHDPRSCKQKGFGGMLAACFCAGTSVCVSLGVLGRMCACAFAVRDLAVSKSQVMTGLCGLLQNSLLHGMLYALLCATACAMAHGRYCCAVGSTTHG